MELYISPSGNDKFSGLLPAPNAQGTDGPLATLEGARNCLRLRQRPATKDPDPRRSIAAIDGPVTVYLRGGRYELKAPLVFFPEDSLPVTFAAYPGETPILDGGVLIAGWRSETLHGRQLWVADLPEVAAGQWYFRRLYVNGASAPRARLPKKGLYQIEDFMAPSTGWGKPGTNCFRCREGDIQAWHNLQDIDVVALHFWIEERMPLAAFDPASRVVTSTKTSRAPLSQDFGPKPAPYYVENVFEALTEPGEWYLDRPSGRLYYLPRAGETIETLQAYAPRTLQLLQLLGDPEKNTFIEWLRFVGLTFRHTDAVAPDDAAYTSDDILQDKGARTRRFAACNQAAWDVPGVIQMRGARHISFEDCQLQHLGWYAIEVDNGCTGIRLVGNTLTDLGAGGIKITGADAAGPLSQRTGYNRITDNHIYNGGQFFHSAVGILARHTFGNLIAHNHIHDFYYTGISVGWVWGYAESVSRDNLIEHNHIHDLGKGLLSDMGGIYLLGVAPGTMVRNNLIHDIACAAYGGWAIYPDEGSSHVIVENNVCYRTTSSVFHAHYSREVVVRNNIFAFGHEGIVALGRAEKHISCNLTRNILLADNEPIYMGGYGYRPQEHRVLDTQLNVCWDIHGPIQAATHRLSHVKNAANPVLTWEQWQRLGQDVHSVLIDPQLADPAHGDFTPVPASPVWALGFQPIDLSTVGPRPTGQRYP